MIGMLNLTLDEDDYRLLDELSRMLGQADTSTRSTVLRTALRIYAWTLMRQAQGCHIAVLTNDDMALLTQQIQGQREVLGVTRKTETGSHRPC